MKVEDLPDKIFAGTKRIPQKRRRKRITPKARFLQFLHQLFAASLLGKVGWWPYNRRNGETGFKATFGSVRIKTSLYDKEYYIEVVFPMPSGNFSIDGSTRYAKVGTFASVFWAATQSFEVRKILNRMALPEGREDLEQFISFKGMPPLTEFKESVDKKIMHKMLGIPKEYFDRSNKRAIYRNDAAELGTKSDGI